MLDLNERIDQMLNWVEPWFDDVPHPRIGHGCIDKVTRSFSVELFKKWYDLEEAIEAIAPGKSLLQPGMRRTMYDPKE